MNYQPGQEEQRGLVNGILRIRLITSAGDSLLTSVSRVQEMLRHTWTEPTETTGGELVQLNHCLTTPGTFSFPNTLYWVKISIYQRYHSNKLLIVKYLRDLVDKAGLSKLKWRLSECGAPRVHDNRTSSVKHCPMSPLLGPFSWEVCLPGKGVLAYIKNIYLPTALHALIHLEISKPKYTCIMIKSAWS